MDELQQLVASVPDARLLLRNMIELMFEECQGPRGRDPEEHLPQDPDPASATRGLR